MYFPQHKAVSSYFTGIREIPKTASLQFRRKPTSSGLEVEARLECQDEFLFQVSGHQYFKNKVSFEDCLATYQGWIQPTFLLCDLCFLGHPILFVL